mmetsp:Transcript_64105/g.162431  ORF Transcript_64105/g.162431 Transcript_64105/m.162431 type:complete len:265 (-) Transcript_64105:112-906(-)
MDRVFRIICLVWLLVAGALADVKVGTAPRAPLTLAGQLQPLASEAGSPEVALCNPCIQLWNQGVNVLLNYIVNVGVIGSCAQLCGHVHSRVGHSACELVCSAVGIKAFIKALNHTDLDPFFFCEEVKACPRAPDDAAIRLLAASSKPGAVAKGDEVQLSVALQVINASGVGEFLIDVDGPVTQSISQGFVLAEGIPMGTSQLAVKLTPRDDTSADPPVVWSPGTYSFGFVVCQGKCGSKHPHSKVFGRQSGNFTLTDSAKAISI